MAFTGTTFSEIETARLEVAEIISNQKRRLTAWKAGAGEIVSALTAAGTEYGPIVPAMAALLATEPANTTFLNKSGEINEHLSNFNDLSAEAGALDVLVNGA